MFAVRRALLSNSVKNTVARSKHSLPELPYEYNALEPIISAEIMQLHHCKHHAAYVNNLNIAEDEMQAALSKGDVNAQVLCTPKIRFNGGGHINHSIFWCNLSPNGGKMDAALKKKIESDFGSVEKMKQQLTEKAVGLPGSGWAWLGYCKKQKSLRIQDCFAQDPLEATTGLVPILGIDVWEHAYYLQYKNVRADYVKAIFDIVNWEDCSARFLKASS